MPELAAWDPDHPAIHSEEPIGLGGSINLRHPNYPCVFRNVGDSWAELTGMGVEYLKKAQSKVLPGSLSFFNGSDFSGDKPWSTLAWLPIDGDPRNSFWIARYEKAATRRGPLDRTVVLLATQSRTANQPATRLGSRTGLRIVAGVSGSGNRCTIRFTALTCSSSLLRWVNQGFSQQAGTLFKRLRGHHYPRFKQAVKEGVARAAGIDPQDVTLDGMKVLGSDVLEGYLNQHRSAQRLTDPATAITIRLRIPAGFPNTAPVLMSLTKRPFVAHANAMNARLFKRDPASRSGIGALIASRPNRSPAELAPFREQVALHGLVDDGGGGTVLTDADFGRLEVRQSRLVAGNEANPQPSRPGQIAHARCNEFAAASAYYNACELFDRMIAYGIPPDDYFRQAAKPLILRYRATIYPGPGNDGKAVNAQVDYDPPTCDLDAQLNPGDLKPLQVRLALADLRRSSSRREPLGIAADPRWMWHEFGHVLIAASTGNLELFFAHSVGDSLAAILADPDSALGDRPSARDMRYVTFPWVYLSRRHDRQAVRGWGWCGSHHRQSQLRALSNSQHKGYLSEQILSSSLFRLYRALGGDHVTNAGVADSTERGRAADYTAYLIMRAVGSLGVENAVPIETPDQFVTALIAEDVATLPANSGPLKDRAGGWAYKVVRWAFEAQGLYASTDPDAIVNAPGLPPKVDLFIDDLRPDSEGVAKRGGYMPVSLDWHPAPRPSEWHAKQTALDVRANGVYVEVSNRGQNDALNSSVRVWYIKWPGNGTNNPPRWDPGKWRQLQLQPGAPATQTVPAGATVLFGPFTGLPGGPNRHLLLAEANCAEDPSNIDPASELPCAAAGTPIVDLVAGDNNLGLRLHEI